MLEDFKVNYANIDIFDLDTYNNIPALSVLNDNSSLFVFIDDYVINAAFENEVTGDLFEAKLVDEEDIPDLYQELANFIFWITHQNPSKLVKAELAKLLDAFEEAGIDPDPEYDPNY